jgi:hypothetical protein
MQTASVLAGVSAKIDFERMRREGFKYGLMPFEFELSAATNLEDLQDFGLTNLPPEDPQEFVRWVHSYPTGERVCSRHPNHKWWFGVGALRNLPRAGLAAPVFVGETIARPPATAAFRTWVEKFKPGGIIGGETPGVIHAGRKFRNGDVIDPAQGITLLDFDIKTGIAVFEDASHAVAAGKF